MKTVLLTSFLLVFAISCVSSTLDLRTRFGLNILNIGTEIFVKQPLNITQAKAKNYTLKSRISSLPLSTCPMYCSDDLILCVIYDEAVTNAIAMQICLPLSRTSNTELDYETQGMTKWSTTYSNGTAEELQCTTAYFVSPTTYLDAPDDERLNSYDNDNLLQGGYLWLTGFNGDIIQIANTTDGATAANFTKQACIVFMGQHYFYNMSSSATCTADKFLPWFLLMKNDVLHAFGFILIGNVADASDSVSRFENPSQSEVETIVPSGAQCMYDYASSPGVTTMHVYIAGGWDIATTYC